MGKLLKCYLMPHPPIMVHEIGRGEEESIRSTINSALEVGEEIKKLEPDTIVILVPPHGPAFSDAMSINVDRVLEGDLGNFGAPGVNFNFKVDSELCSILIKECAHEKIPVAPIDDDSAREYGIPNRLDHGSLVPLYFVNKKYNDYRIVHITYGLLSKEELYHFGRIIRKTIEKSSRNAVFIASGDLSHRLNRDAPAGYNPNAWMFDDLIVKNLKAFNSDEIMYMDGKILENAGECGYRSTLVLLGTLDGSEISPDVKSYEGPFGVGYCVAGFNIGEDDDSRKKVEYYYMKRRDIINNIRECEDEYVKLARMSLEHYIKKGGMLPEPQGLPEEMLKNKAGVFVSLKKHGELRGCIGTIEAVQSNIAGEIIHNAVSAGTGDPRFFPVDEDELKDIVYSVDILGKPEGIESKEQLNPERYGVIVRKGNRSGLLLPNIEGVDTVDEQVSIALRKAGIRENENYSMERFVVIRHK